MDDFEIKKIERKIDKAVEKKEFREAKDLYMELASYLTRYDDNEGGLDAYKNALSICENEGWESDLAVVHRMIGETYCTLGEFEKSVKYANLYLNYSKKSNDKIEEQRGYATLGRIYFCWAEFLESSKSKPKNIVQEYLKKSVSAYKASLKICLNELNNVDVREKEEMKSRLFQNLGLVMGSMGNYKEAHNNFAIAIQINKTQNFKENLYWCYLNESEHFFRAGELANACTYCDFAVKAATTKKEEFDALKLKGKALLKQGKLLNAKSVLREVYKKQQGKDKEATALLRATIFLCKVEHMIKSASETDYKEMKDLYEKKGDAYCAVKLYEQGIQAYLKMLNFAEKISKSREELLPCYSSLAQTYRDDGQYSFAMFYCQQELEVINHISIEGSKSYMFLGELHYLHGSEYDVVYNQYKEALDIARTIGDKAQESVVLTALIQVQKDFSHFTEAEENRRLLEEIQNELDEFSDEENNEEESFDFDVDDNELLSDGEDIKARHQARRTCYKIKRNQKGETELHVAAIKGDASKVKKLLQNGHPVKERDLAGWSVLHEAANHGYDHIVKILLDYGADVNDPGGIDCEGITPLHDAAENGHFNVIKVLLTRGACKAVVTNRGDTPLDCLKRWRERTDASAEEIAEYEEVSNALKSNLDLAVIKEKRKRLTAAPRPNKLTTKSEEKILILDEEKERSCATEMYRLAMEGVRRRPEAKLGSKIEKQSKPALINEEEVVEDWLEEDMAVEGQSSKRRKIQGNNTTITRSDQEMPLSDDVESIPELPEMDSETELSSGKSRSVSPVITVSKKFFTIQRSEEPNEGKEPETVLAIADQSEAEQMIMNKAVEKSPETEKVWHKFKVPLMNDLFLIPVLESDMSKLTVQWLANSVAERYNKVYGRRPEILLTTGDDAITIGNDPLTLLANEEIKTRILQWKKISLGDMYIQQLKDFPQPEVVSSLFPVGSKPLYEVANALNSFERTGDLILKDRNLDLANFLPVLEIFKKTNQDVKIMDLSRNFLGDEIIDPLIDFFENRNIQRLYLISNGITIRGIKKFAERISILPEQNLNRINCLDFSFNNLGDDSAEFLNVIIDKIKNLDYFGTDYCGLTKSLKELTISNNATLDAGNVNESSSD